MSDWVNFYSQNESEISDEFLRNGYVIREVESEEALKAISSYINEKAAEYVDSIGLSKFTSFDEVHNQISPETLNEFRLKIINDIHAAEWFRSAYFNLAKNILGMLVGNELAMQIRPNLSIQLPGDESSLLPIHSDVWSGDSPYEIVVWMPLVDCFKTKSMYILTPEKWQKHSSGFPSEMGLNSEALYEQVKDDLTWLEVKYGEVLLFNQNLPHGNRINLESETRWSMNCRFKGVFTPYEDKKLGEFFEPITLKPLTKFALGSQKV